MFYVSQNENSVMWQLLAQGELDTFENLSQILQRIPEGTIATVQCVSNYIADKAKKDLAGFTQNMPVDMASSSSFVQVNTANVFKKCVTVRMNVSEYTTIKQFF